MTIRTVTEWLRAGLENPGLPIDQWGQDYSVHEGEKFDLRVTTWSDRPNIDKAALLVFRVEDQFGNEVTLDDPFARSTAVGYYRYVVTGNSVDPATTTLSLTIPSGGRRLFVAGHKWRNDTQTLMLGEEAIHRADAPGASWREALDSFTGVPEGTVEMTVHQRLENLRKADKEHRARLEFVNSQTGLLLPEHGQRVDSRHGSYTTFTRDETRGPDNYTATFRVPEGTTHVRWRFPSQKVWSLAKPEISVLAHHRDTLDNFMNDLDDGQMLILIDSTAPPLGSGTITIRPNNMANMYASLGIGVISVGFGRLQGNRRRQAEHIFQAGREEMDSVIARVARESERRRCIYICSSFASTTAVGRTDVLKLHGWDVLYEIRDNMEEFNRVGYSQWYSSGAEILQCVKSDRITAVSPALAEKMTAIAPGVQVVVSPNAIMRRFVDGSVDMRKIESVEARRLSGRIGYVGHLTEAWFDWHRFLLAAEALSTNEFEIVGPGLPEYIELPPNVTYLGPKKQDELAVLAQRWSVGIIPFIDSPLTLGVDPNKLFEYVAWGMRTVSARMGSIEDCPTAVAYDSDESFVEALRDALHRPWSQTELDAANAFLNESTWDARARQTLALLEVEL